MDVLAYAKLNLSLLVGAVQRDGYHPVDSLIQTIDLADRITVERLSNREVVASNSLGIPASEDLGAAAARAVLSEAGSSIGVRIHIHKAIPVGAGLGGGSSDAAAVLVATNSLLDAPLPPRDLHKLGASLGADVPLFLTGGLLRATGRGETIHPSPSVRSETFVVIVPPVHCNTALVYRRFDEIPSLRSDVPSSSGVLELAHNDLEPAALDLYPSLGTVAAVTRSMVSEAGALFAGMSGSGSSYYAAFRSSEEAQRARSSLAVLLPDTRIFVTRSTSVGHEIEGRRS